ncbi:Osteopetrosis-associated transmembrane protein 1 precursor family protein [Acanthocheilonema viteae]
MNGVVYVISCFCSYVIANNELNYASSDPWDLNAHCQPYIEDFAKASSRMIRCAAAYSSPPKVCTYCIEEYIAFKQIEYKLRKLENVFSLDNTTCSRVIYDNYLISYVSEVSMTITTNIWENSRCSSCVKISWHLESNSTEYAYYNDTIKFENKLYAWRHCVSNFSFLGANESIICEKCLSSFNELFQFYWYIYTTPNINFCLDVETTMNDTMNLWHNVWHCPDDRVEELRDWTLLGYSLAFLIIITAFFYAGSYIQSSEIQRHLVQYSRLDAPRGLRSHLLSSSTLDRISSSVAGGTEQLTNLQ